MARYDSLAYTTASVPGSGGSLNFEIDLTANFIDLYKIKITPSGGTGTCVFSIFKAAARAASDLIYKTLPWPMSAAFVDPVQSDSGVYTECAEGFVCRYEDTDGAMKLYCTIVNNDASARTFDIAIQSAPSPFAANIVGVPDSLTATGSANGLAAISNVMALINNNTITEAEFRAKRINTGELLPYSEDLRTASEGGTFTHNGDDQLIITGIAANAGGATYAWTSLAAGRWYFVWKLKNASGWSNWSDGNTSPSTVIQWFETISNTDSGPPDDWQVTVERGTQSDTFIVRATRPKTNGNVIKNFAVQIKDASTGSWRTLDANAGAAETHYDGSGVNHTLDPADGLITNGGGGWGTAVPGDVLLIDVRGNGSWGIEYAIGEIVKTIGASTIELQRPILPLPTAHETAGVYDQLRVKIVKPPWKWNSEGYMGGWANNGGYWDYTFSQYQRFLFPDYSTKEFVSDPIPVNPAATTIQARVWFQNGYSLSDGNIIYSSTVNGGSGVLEDGYIWTSFGDRNWWVPAIQGDGNVSISFLSGGLIKAESLATGASLVGAVGAIGRFMIFPNSSGKIVVRAKFTVTQFSLPIGGAGGRSCGVAIVLSHNGSNNSSIIENGARGGFIAQSYTPDGSTPQLWLGHLVWWTQSGGLLNMSLNTAKWNAAIAMPGLPFDIELRLTIDEDTVNLPGGGCTVFKRYEYQIGGGGWNDLPGPAPSSTMYDRQASHVAIRGIIPYMLFIQTSATDGDNATLTEFEIVNGIVARY